VPHKDPTVPDKLKATDQFSNRALIDHLELFDHISANIPRTPKPVLIADASTRAPKEAPRPVLPQQLVDGTLRIETGLFDNYVLSHIKPLKDDAKPEERIAAIKELFELFKVGGILAVEYQFSAERMPKSPNDVLTPDKEGRLRADCDELSLLFIAAAGKLNIKLTGISLMELTFQIEKPEGKVEQALHTAVLTIDGGKYLVDFTFRTIEPLDSVDIQALSKVYEGRRAAGGQITKVLGMGQIDTLPGMVALHYKELGAYYQTKGNMPAAIEAFGQQLILDPNNQQLRVGLAQVCFSMGSKEFEKGNLGVAEKYFKKGLELDDNAQAHFLLGRAYFEANKYAEAANEFKRTFELEPDNMKTMHNFVLSLMKAGKYPEAETEYARLIQAKSDKREFYVGIDLYTDMKRYDKVVDICNEILKIDPKDATAHIHRVEAQFKLAMNTHHHGDNAKARDYFKKAEGFCLEALMELDYKSKEYSDINANLTLIRGNLKALGQ